MEKTPVWLILNRISAAERSELEKFSAIPHFGGSPELCSLLLYLQEQALKRRCPSRVECYRAVRPGSPFRQEHFRQLLHKLTELVRTYLTIQALEKNPTIKNRLLAERFEQLDLAVLSQQVLQKAEKKLEAARRHDPAWHEERFQVRRLFYGVELAGARTQKLNLQDFSDELERSFIMRKLKLSCELISHSSVYRTDYDFGLLDAVLDKVGQSEQLLREPGIAVYYHCCLALLNPDDAAHFDALKPYLNTMAEVFPQQECRDILLLSLNYCIKKLNQGMIRYSHEGLELYKLALEKGFLLEKGEISRFTFRNAVAMGLKIGAFDWVENFILHHQDKLPKLHRESMVSFNLARLSYERKQYDQALAFLQKADYQDILLALAAKTLLLKIFYETESLRLLDAAIDSFNIFLRRKKVLAYHRENYQNFIKYLKRLIALNPANLPERNALRAAILSEETLTEKDWFLRKLE